MKMISSLSKSPPRLSIVVLLPGPGFTAVAASDVFLLPPSTHLHRLSFRTFTGARPLPPLLFTYLLLLWTEDLLCFIGLEFIPVIHHFCTRCCLDLASRNPMGMAPVFL